MKRIISLLISFIFVFLAAFPAFAENETTKAPKEASASETKPPKVENLEAYKTTESSITIHWKKVSGVDAYAVYKYNAKKDKYEILTVVEDTKYEVKKLNPGKTYKFVVKSAVYKGDDIVYSAISKELKAVTAPKKVGGIFVPDIETDSISLSWTKVDGATGYEIWIYDKNQSNFVLNQICEKNSVKITGLSENTLYSFKIRAIRSIEGAVAYGTFSDIFSEFTHTTKTVRTKAQAAKLYNTKVNSLKKEKDMTVSYKKTVDTETISCSKYSLTRTVKNMMNLFKGKLETSYKFTGGQSDDLTVNGFLQPKDKTAKIRAKDMTKFSFKKENGSAELKIVLKSDETAFNGKTKTEPLPSHNARAVIPPFVKDQETAPLTIKNAKEKFEGSTLTLSLNKNSKVKSLKVSCPVRVTANCSVSTIDFSTTVRYVMTESFSVKYPEKKK